MFFSEGHIVAHGFKFPSRSRPLSAVMYVTNAARTAMEALLALAKEVSGDGVIVSLMAYCCPGSELSVPPCWAQVLP